MKTPIEIREVNIPEGVKIEVNDGKVVVEGTKGKLERILHHPKVEIRKEDNKIIIKAEMPKRNEKALVGTFAGHIKNMIKGVTEGFTYKMKIVYSHFPIKANVKGNEFIIENFLGEKAPRKAKLFGNVKVSVKGSDVIIEGINREEVGQTAANIERATKVRNKDIRVFQDGIYIVDKDKGA